MIALTGCAGLQPTVDTPPDLSGNWEMTLPAGFRRQTPIEKIDDTRYLIPKIGVLSGVYEHQGNRLVVVKPNDERLTGFVWEIRDAGSLVLIQSAPVEKIGSDYTGATLRRLGRMSRKQKKILGLWVTWIVRQRKLPSVLPR